jgi:hypothetical protein
VKNIVNHLAAAAIAIAIAACSAGDIPGVDPNRPPRPGLFNPLTIFTDASCTALRPDVTREFIETACNEYPYRQIALQMFDGAYPTEFRVAEIEPLPDPAIDAARNKTARYGIMDNPTGISVNSFDTLRLFISGLPAAGAATLRLQTLSRTVTGGYSTLPGETPLANGLNTIVAGLLGDTNQGLAYIRYYYPDENDKPANIKVNIHGGAVNGYYRVDKHAPSDWPRLIAGAVNGYFDIIARHAVITAPTEWFRRHTGTRGKDLADAYDAVVLLEWKFMGLLPPPDGFGGRHRTRAYFHQEVMNPGVAAYATDHRTAYPGEYMAKPDAILGADVWVFGHEHGHINQTRPGLRWAGMVEVTTNIHSMYIRTRARDMIPDSPNTAVNTNLQTVPDGGYANTYERAFNWYFGRERPLATPTPHNRNDNNAHLFHQLVPFWQLYLYLDNVLGKTGTHGAGFYEDIYEHYRSADPTVGSRTDGQHQIYFAELVCRTARVNLADFFRETGFFQPYSSGSFMVSQAMIDAAVNNIKDFPAPTQAMEYITDANAFIFKNKLALQTGSPVAISGGRVVAPPVGWMNAVAFEARESDATGDIRCIFTADNGATPNTFNGNGFVFNTSLHHLYAVAHDGERREVPLTGM